MKNHRTALLGLAFSCSLLSPGTATADDKGYVLATGELPPAGTVLMQNNRATLNGPLVIQKGPTTIQGTMTSKGSYDWKISIISPDKYVEELSAESLVAEITLGEKKIPFPEHQSPLLNVPTAVEKKGREWVATQQDGSALTAEQQAKRAKASSMNRLIASQLRIYGKEPRKPGDKWQVDASTLPLFAGVMHPSGTIDCEFVEVKELESGPAAVVKMKVDLTGKPPESKPDEKPLIGHFSGEINELRSIPYQVNLSEEVKGEVEMNFTKASTGLEMKVTGPMSVTETFSIQKP